MTARNILATLAAALVLLAGRAGAAEVSLAWDAPAGYTDGTSPIVGELFYVLYWGTASSNYTATAACGTNLTKRLVGMAPGPMYYFAVACHLTNGFMSGFSNEVAWDVRLLAGATVSPTRAGLTIMRPATFTNGDPALPPTAYRISLGLAPGTFDQVVTVPYAMSPQTYTTAYGEGRKVYYQVEAIRFTTGLASAGPWDRRKVKPPGGPRITGTTP